MENMKCYINHKFTTIAWGLVFIIILFCGCSNMIGRLRAISDAELSVALLCDNTNATNIEIPLGEAQSFSFIVKDKNSEEQEIIRDALLKYCELDTLAMIKIWQNFKQVTNYE